MQNALCHNMLTHRSTSEHRGGVFNTLSLPRCKFYFGNLFNTFILPKATAVFIAALLAYFLIHLTISKKLEANMNIIISMCLQIFIIFLLNDAIYCSITE